MEKRIIHNISWSVFWKAIATVLLLWLAYIARDALIVLVFSLILSSAVEPFISMLKRHGVPRILTAIFIYLFGLAAIGTLLFFVIPPVVSELRTFLEGIDALAPDIAAYFSAETFEQIKTSLLESANLITQSGQSIFSFLASILGGVTVLIATGIITFYLLINENGVTEFIKTVAPAASEPYLVGLWLRVKNKLGRWFQVQLSLSILVGVLSFVALKIIGVPFAMLLAVLSGMFEIVPIAGPIFAGAIALLVALTQNTQLAFFTLIAYVIIQQIENNLAVPLITKRIVGINPVIVMLALMAGSAVYGVVGMILAVPAVVVLMEIVEDWGKHKNAPRQEVDIVA